MPCGMRRMIEEDRMVRTSTQPHKPSVSAGLSVFIAGLFMGTAIPAIAQESDSPIEPLEPPQTEEIIQLEEMAISAERVTPVEGAVTATVTAQEVHEAIAKDVSEVLKTEVPGVTGVRRGGINLDPVIRGLREDRRSVMTNGTKIWRGGPFRMDPPTSADLIIRGGRGRADRGY